MRKQRLKSFEKLLLLVMPAQAGIQKALK